MKGGGEARSATAQCGMYGCALSVTRATGGCERYGCHYRRGATATCCSIYVVECGGTVRERFGWIASRASDTA